MTKEIKGRVENKYDAYEKWANLNPVLLKGEIALIESETGFPDMVIGDGISDFNTLYSTSLQKSVVPDFATESEILSYLAKGSE